jgi:hypothetical protein
MLPLKRNTIYDITVTQIDNMVDGPAKKYITDHYTVTDQVLIDAITTILDSMILDDEDDAYPYPEEDDAL